MRQISYFLAKRFDLKKIQKTEPCIVEKLDIGGIRVNHTESLLSSYLINISVASVKRYLELRHRNKSQALFYSSFIRFNLAKNKMKQIFTNAVVNKVLDSQEIKPI